MTALLLALTAALAGPCDVEGPRAVGPVTAGLEDGDLGQARRTCPRTEAGFAPGGSLLVDTPGFYGLIIGGATFDGSVAVSDDLEVFGAIEVFRYQAVISALSDDFIGPGHTWLGASRVLKDGDKLVLALNGRLVLPTAFGLYVHSWPFAADVGLSGVYATGSVWRLHGQLSLLGSAAATKGPVQPRGGIAPTIGAEWRPGKVFGLVADVSSSFGFTAPLDTLAGGIGFRFGIGRRLGIELDGTVPIVGEDRTLVAAELRSALLLGPLE